ncbi:MAG: Asp23/Gls24 family envelope stress response protein [Gordonia sp. (in: high G+C Gram-positive bacteria)]
MAEQSTTENASTEKAASAGAPSTEKDAGSSSKEVARRDLGDDRGQTSIADMVVAKIAGIAAREIGGVYDLGGAGERMVGKVREVLPGTSSSVTQGITVEVGERQAAVDVSIIAEYGIAIHQLAAAIRRNVIAAIEGMTGLEVTEVNVAVHDIHFADDAPAETPRVQ